MSNILTYKGYTGSVEYSSEDEVFYGKIEFITDTVLYEGSSVEEFKKCFWGQTSFFIRVSPCTAILPWLLYFSCKSLTNLNPCNMINL
jgi:predicted HicB family RNase H-like nuclease